MGTPCDSIALTVRKSLSYAAYMSKSATRGEEAIRRINSLCQKPLGTIKSPRSNTAKPNAAPVVVSILLFLTRFTTISTSATATHKAAKKEPATKRRLTRGPAKSPPSGPAFPSPHCLFPNQTPREKCTADERQDSQCEQPPGHTDGGHGFRRLFGGNSHEECISTRVVRSQADSRRNHASAPRTLKVARPSFGILAGRC